MLNSNSFHHKKLLKIAKNSQNETYKVPKLKICQKKTWMQIDIQTWFNMIWSSDRRLVYMKIKK